MNWSYKILLLFSGFVLLVLTMVFLSYRQEVPLVSEDYYQQELNYQNEIDMLRNARSLDDHLVIETVDAENSLVIRYPEGQAGRISGKIIFMRPSNPDLDTNFAVKADDSLVQSIRTGGMQKGLWKIKIYWEQGNRKFLEEKDIIIQ